MKNYKKKVCKVCNGIFKHYSSQAKYCSIECQAVVQKKYSADKPNGKEWYMIVEYINERDNYTCQDCKEQEKTLYVHHKKYLCEGGTNNPENLITLCAKCHAKAHKFDYLEEL